MEESTSHILNPAEYTKIPHVAVLDECTLPIPAKDGSEGYDYFQVDPEFLQKVAANGNRREAETGDMCPLVIGRHTKKNADEKSQPEIVGYARNWSVGQLGKTNRLAAFADFWVRNEHLERVKKFPRRSAEVWRSRAEVDPIALLGATTPERDLGLLPIALHRHQDQEISATFYCDRGFDMPIENDKDTVGKESGKPGVADTPGQADVSQTLNKLAAAVADLTAKFDQLMTGGSGGDGETQSVGGPQEGDEGEPGGEMSDEEIEKLIQELEGGQGGGAGNPGADQGQPPRKEEAPVQSMGYPGNQNTTVPGEQPSKNSRLDPETARLREEVETLKLERARDQITAKINELESAGVLFENKEAEIRDLLALPADMRPSMLNRIEKQYKRAPVATGPLGAVQASGAATTVGSITEEQRDQVVRLAREDGLSYESAFKKQFGRYPWESPAKL